MAGMLPPSSAQPGRNHWGSRDVAVPAAGGCNTGGCHGKPDGQNGFNLSLHGSRRKNDSHTSCTKSSESKLDATGTLPTADQVGDFPETKDGTLQVPVTDTHRIDFIRRGRQAR